MKMIIASLLIGSLFVSSGAGLHEEKSPIDEENRESSSAKTEAFDPKLSLRVLAPPEIVDLKITDFGDDNDDTNNNVTIQCLTQSDKTMSYEWKAHTEGKIGLRENEKTEGDLLSIYHFEKANEGTFCCVASNALGTAEKCTELEPLVLEIYHTITAGSSIYLECRVSEGYFYGKIEWVREDGRSFGPNFEKLASGTLVIKNITPEDEGSYTCSGLLEGGFYSSATTNMRVTVDEDIIVKLGDKVKLTCNTDDSKPNVQWKKFSTKTNSYEAVGGENLKSAVYEIESLLENEAGLYLCLANNSAGSSNKAIRVVSKPPVLEVHPKDSHEVMSGGSVTLECVETAGYSNMEIEWTREDGQLFAPNVKSAKGSLTITNITIKEKGRYKCSATKGVISVSVIREIEVQPPPVTHLPPTTESTETTTVKSPSTELISSLDSGSELRIKPKLNVSSKYVELFPKRSNYVDCKIVSFVDDPTIKPTWRRAGELPIPSNFHVNGGRLEINSPTKADAGEYLCVALKNNGIELARLSSTLEFIDIPQLRVIVPDKFWIGDTITLTCENSESVKRLTWQVRDRLLLTNEKTQGNTLTIHGLKKENSGDFCCLGVYARRTVGDCGLVALPRIIELSKSSLAAAVDETVEVDCRIVNPDDQKIILKWERSDDSKSSNVIMEKEGHFTLSQVTEMDSGDYVCRGLNTAGEELARETFTLTIVSRPETVEITIVNATTDGDLLMVCNYTGDIAYHYWSAKDGDLLPNEEQHWPNQLIIKGVKKANDHTFCCEAINAAGSLKNCTQLPTLLAVSKPCSRILANNSFNVSCEVLGSGASKIHVKWRRANDEEFSENATQDNGLLKIPNIEKTDAGDYNCQGLDESDNIVLQKTVSLEVVRPPNAVFTPDKTHFRVGDDVTLTCTATGDEPMKYELTTEDGSLRSNEEIKDNTVTVRNIPENFERKYWCKATNAIGTFATYMTLKIEREEKSSD